MCGIVGAVAQREVSPILIEGLKRLEYRGYDSAGLALQTESGELQDRRAVGKVAALEARLQAEPAVGRLGIAHTRWATHGGVNAENAHPQISDGVIAVVHNGIIENFEALRTELAEQGFKFGSETDTEVIAHLIHAQKKTGLDLLAAVRASLGKLKGAYAIAVIAADEPGRMVVARAGSPLVIGLGIGETFAASDVAALLPVTQRFIYLEEGDCADLVSTGVMVYDRAGVRVERQVHESSVRAEALDKGQFRHYMIKEIFDQPQAIDETIRGRISETGVLPESLGPAAVEMLARVRNVHIVACGTSFHAGLVGRHWLESIAGVPCNVELASEYRYRDPVIPADTLFITLSQSGETADTLAALRYANAADYLGSLTICNSPQSSMVRESDLVMMTVAGAEIGVASTKAFTTQLVAMLLISAMLARVQGRLEPETETSIVQALRELPGAVERILLMDGELERLAEDFGDKDHALFLGRGSLYPIAMEGALKLKEISYIHAEAYAAGELKHGPLALIDEHMPVIVVAPSNDLLDKLKSNMQVVRARGGQLYVFADDQSGIVDEEGVKVVAVPATSDLSAPIIYTVPLQLLSYHVAVLKGTDVDQPRNLAKSVTVE